MRTGTAARLQLLQRAAPRARRLISASAVRALVSGWDRDRCRARAAPRLLEPLRGLLAASPRREARRAPSVCASCPLVPCVLATAGRSRRDGAPDRVQDAVHERRRVRLAEPLGQLDRLVDDHRRAASPARASARRHAMRRMLRSSGGDALEAPVGGAPSDRLVQALAGRPARRGPGAPPSPASRPCSRAPARRGRPRGPWARASCPTGRASAARTPAPWSAFPWPRPPPLETPGRRPRPCACPARSPGRRSASTMATAARAASAPLFSGPGAERARACASSSTVSTPKPTGTPVSRATAARPAAASRAMCS